MARRRRTRRCACGMSDVADIGYTRRRKRRTTRHLHDIADIGASRAYCKLIHTRTGRVQKGCYRPGVGFRFVKR